MTRMFSLAAAFLCTCAGASAASMPGQHINACASASYCAHTRITAAATVEFVDHANEPAQSQSPPTVATIEKTCSPVSAGPATSFVAPEDSLPVYAISTRALCSQPSLVGRRVKLAGRIVRRDGVTYLNDGGALPCPDGSASLGVQLRGDLISALPADGSTATVQGVVRQEPDGQLSILPMSDAAVKHAQ